MMKPARSQRLLLIVCMVAGISIALSIALYTLQNNINLYYSPSQILSGEAPIHQRIRGGGLVSKGSLKRQEGLNISFIITDSVASIPVVYQGILPDLFREGQGVVVQGTLNEAHVFYADEVLAKHDENYMPPEVAQAIDAAQHSITPTVSTP